MNNDVEISLSSGREFVKHDPGVLDYFIDFGNKADFLTYEAGLYDRLDVRNNEEVTFRIKPAIGDSMTFVGRLYRAERTKKSNVWKMSFVSKYYPGLMGMIPLYGSGKTSDIIGSFYSKAGVPRLSKQASDVTVDNLVFPRTTRVDQAITYLLNRSTTAAGGFLVGTVVGDLAIICDIKAGVEDVEGLYYQAMRIKDDRRRVDILGGLKVELANDSEQVDPVTSTQRGLAEVENRNMYAITDQGLARAWLKAKQARLYYGGYVAEISLVGWFSLLGRNIVVSGGGDIFENDSWIPQLDRGKYFVNSQVLHMDMKDSYPKMRCGVQLVA